MADITLKKRSDLGRRLTYREVDENWTKLAEVANKDTSITATLAAGANYITHNRGRKARFVNFFKSTGEPIEYYWQRDPENQLNKIIVTVPEGTPEHELTDLEINITTI